MFIGQGEKMSKYNYIYQARKRAKHVHSDGKFKRDEIVGLRTYDIPDFQFNVEYIQATISMIQRDHREKFLYQLSYLDICGNRAHIWVNQSMFKKEKECDFRPFNFRGTYKVGDIVCVNRWWQEYRENVTITRVTFNQMNNNLVYWAGNDIHFFEQDVKLGKRIITDYHIKSGDLITPIKQYTINKLNIEVEEVLSFDSDTNPGMIYLKIKGSSVLYNALHYKKVRPPLIIYSEVDPYGEEDWYED